MAKDLADEIVGSGTPVPRTGRLEVNARPAN